MQDAAVGPVTRELVRRFSLPPERSSSNRGSRKLPLQRSHAAPKWTTPSYITTSATNSICSWRAWPACTPETAGGPANTAACALEPTLPRSSTSSGSKAPGSPGRPFLAPAQAVPSSTEAAKPPPRCGPMARSHHRRFPRNSPRRMRPSPPLYDSIRRALPPGWPIRTARLADAVQEAVADSHISIHILLNWIRYPVYPRHPAR